MYNEIRSCWVVARGFGMFREVFWSVDTLMMKYARGGYFRLWLREWRTLEGEKLTLRMLYPLHFLCLIRISGTCEQNIQPTSVGGSFFRTWCDRLLKSPAAMTEDYEKVRPPVPWHVYRSNKHVRIGGSCSRWKMTTDCTSRSDAQRNVELYDCNIVGVTCDVLMNCLFQRSV